MRKFHISFWFLFITLMLQSHSYHKFQNCYRSTSIFNCYNDQNFCLKIKGELNHESTLEKNLPNICYSKFTCYINETSQINLFSCEPKGNKFIFTTNLKRNKICHIYNGNITNSQNKSLKFVQWNKGNSHFENKISDIQNVISSQKPDILALSEANLKDNYKIYINQFPEYNFEKNLMFNIANISRNLLLIKKGILYKRRHDLEQQDTCTIWIEVKFS